jgi:acyl-CoA thioester hydrolase
MHDNGWQDIDIRVRYKDTDRMGVVYYGNYLTFFEVGRTEFMRSRGIRYADLEASGYALAVVETGAKYHGNVGYDELVTVRTRITQKGRARLGFDYEVFDQKGGLLVSGFTVHAFLDSQGKVIKIPELVLKVIKEEGAAC